MLHSRKLALQQYVQISIWASASTSQTQPAFCSLSIIYTIICFLPTSFILALCFVTFSWELALFFTMLRACLIIVRRVRRGGLSFFAPICFLVFVAMTNSDRIHSVLQCICSLCYPMSPRLEFLLPQPLHEWPPRVSSTWRSGLRTLSMDGKPDCQ